jgi:hypothetical protein
MSWVGRPLIDAFQTTPKAMKRQSCAVDAQVCVDDSPTVPHASLDYTKLDDSPTIPTSDLPHLPFTAQARRQRTPARRLDDYFSFDHIQGEAGPSTKREGESI